MKEYMLVKEYMLYYSSTGVYVHIYSIVDNIGHYFSYEMSVCLSPSSLFS